MTRYDGACIGTVFKTMTVGAVVVAAGLVLAVPEVAVAGSDPVIAQTSEKTKPRKRPRRAELSPVFAVSRAFRDAPEPGFEKLNMRTTASDGSHQEDISYRLQDSTGVVTAVTEESKARFRNLDGAEVQQELASDSRYVLGGLLFVEGEWTGERSEQNGLRETIREGAETRDFENVSGKLFPLAVGNELVLAYKSRIKTAREFIDNNVTFRVTRELPAQSYDRRLTGKIFVIDAEFKERIADESSIVREEIYYAQDIGWPVLVKRRDEVANVTLESRLTELKRRLLE
ncbi:MAG: hypothetical protein QNJ94_20250 [Alphaproteobacteria bacterium]|nr:hypothetical protein [Alphaproteobacteria bacterium]